MFNAIRAELRSLAPHERLFLFFSMIVGFGIAAEYSITRPALNSLFVAAYGAAGFPYAWLCTIPLNLLVIWFYNRNLPRIGPLSMMFRVVAAISLMQIVAPLIAPLFPPFLFLQFAWKEVYILLMFKQLWSMIHATISSERAKVLYGVLYLMGSLGSLAGSAVPAFLASTIGTSHLFWISPVLYLGIAAAFWAAFQRSQATGYRQVATGSAVEGLRMIGRNRVLMGVLLLVVFMQVTVALSDYRFQHFLAEQAHQVDARTQLAARVFGSINLISFFLQLVGGVIFVQMMGVRRGHATIPLILLALTAAVTLSPTFALAAIAFVLTKSIDFSLFGVIREMLWIPLQLDEKYRAKAVIDVFAYRTSKALASFLLLGLQWIPGIAVVPLVNSLLVAVLICWVGTVYWLLPRTQSSSPSFM